MVSYVGEINRSFSSPEQVVGDEEGGREGPSRSSGRALVGCSRREHLVVGTKFLVSSSLVLQALRSSREPELHREPCLVCRRLCRLRWVRAL